MGFIRDFDNNHPFLIPLFALVIFAVLGSVSLHEQSKREANESEARLELETRKVAALERIAKVAESK